MKSLLVRLFNTSFYIMKGDRNEMITVYVALIIYGRRTIDQVPVSLKNAVLAELAMLGLDGYGK